MIHKTSIVDSKANIATNVEIGPYTVIGPKVEIQDREIAQEAGSRNLT